METEITKDKGFHYKDGIYFSRTKDDGVLIESYRGEVLKYSIEIDFDSWVSIVYSLTGEKGDTQRLMELEERLRGKE